LLFPETPFVAVGAVAEAQCEAAGIPVTRIRHPSYGGAPEFARNLRDVLTTKRAA